MDEVLEENIYGERTIETLEEMTVSCCLKNHRKHITLNISLMFILFNGYRSCLLLMNLGVNY